MITQAGGWNRPRNFLILNTTYLSQIYECWIIKQLKSVHISVCAHTLIYIHCTSCFKVKALKRVIWVFKISQYLGYLFNSPRVSASILPVDSRGPTFPLDTPVTPLCRSGHPVIRCSGLPHCGIWSWTASGQSETLPHRFVPLDKLPTFLAPHPTWGVD